eukprot:884407-Pyramimonas_sp.AAC.1
MRFTSGPARVSQLLTSPILNKVVQLAVAANVQDGFQELVIISWAFLLRGQSEGIPLEAGTAREEGALPAGRHSS